jgi:hypothetical protein
MGNAISTTCAERHAIVSSHRHKSSQNSKSEKQSRTLSAQIQRIVFSETCPCIFHNGQFGRQPKITMKHISPFKKSRVAETERLVESLSSLRYNVKTINDKTSYAMAGMSGGREAGVEGEVVLSRRGVDSSA